MSNKNGIVVLSPFDGISCAQMALKRAGILVREYYASEVDAHAIKATQHNFPNTIQLGDVRKVDIAALPRIDLLCGGSPCQSFSFAGKRKGMTTKDEQEILTLEHYLELKEQEYEFEGQSYLFWEYIRLLSEVRKTNPDVLFFLENVMMAEKWKSVITKAIGVNPLADDQGRHGWNSAWVSAQNRERLYWTNIGLEPQGLFGDLMQSIKQPKDKGLLLKDVLEENVPEKYFLSDKMLNYLNTRKANYDAGKINFKTGEDVASCINASSGHLDISDNIIIDINRKSRCFTAGGHSGGLHSQMELIKIVAMRGRNPENPKSRQSGLHTEQQLEPRSDGKTNCLTSVQKDNLVMQLNMNTESNGTQPHQQNRVYDVNGISPALMAQMSCGTHAILEGVKIRRLTPIECCRLQTVSDTYFYDETGKQVISDTQIYKTLGNGWTVDIIAHIFSYIEL